MSSEFIGAYIDDSQHLVIHRSDNTSFIAGSVAPRPVRAVDAIHIDSRTRDIFVTYENGDCDVIGQLCDHTGPTGPTGPTGMTGISIVHTYVDMCGYLNIMYSNNKVTVAGYVQGPTGPTGALDNNELADLTRRVDALETMITMQPAWRYS